MKRGVILNRQRNTSSEVAGVSKKMKDKAFARAVKREDITAGAEMLGLSVEEHVGNCLGAMQTRAGELGL